MGRRTAPTEVSVDEYIAMLRNSSLPTLVVEGKDDMIVFRRFEVRLADLQLSVLPVGGRDKVLQIFERVGEIGGKIPIVFIADQDLWVLSEVPEHYRDPRMVFTSGYSIENDVFEDGSLPDLLFDSERETFHRELLEFIDWYALAVSRWRQNCSESIRSHPDYVLAIPPAARLQLRRDESFPEDLREKISANYSSLLRGKSLIALLLRQINRKNRNPHHNSGSLLEMVAINPKANIERLMALVREQVVNFS